MNIEWFTAWLGFLLIPVIILVWIGLIKHKNKRYFLTVLASWIGAALLLTWLKVKF